MNVSEMLEKTGFKAETLEKIRLWQGVVGKASYVVGLAIIGLSVIALRATNEILLGGLAVGIIGLAIWHSHKTRHFAKENPAAALLEGAELVAYRQIEIAAKDIATPPETPLIANPSSAPRALIQAEPVE